MMKLRRGEDHSEDCVRSPRYFETDEGWFLRTREGIPVGPYEKEFDVKLAASLLSPKLKQSEGGSDIVYTIQSFLRDPCYGPKPKLRIVELQEEIPVTGLQVIGRSLKQGCANLFELARTQISMFGSIPPVSARSVRHHVVERIARQG